MNNKLMKLIRIGIYKSMYAENIINRVQFEKLMEILKEGN